MGQLDGDALHEALDALKVGLRAGRSEVGHALEATKRIAGCQPE
jgi:hypothetical protein